MGTNGKSPKQDLATAKDLAIELIKERESPLPYIRLTN